MCVDDRKVWVRDLEKEKKFVIFEVLMNWMNVEMKLWMCVIVLIRVGLFGKCFVYYFKFDSDKFVWYKCWLCKILLYWFD